MALAGVRVTTSSPHLSRRRPVGQGHLLPATPGGRLSRSWRARSTRPPTRELRQQYHFGPHKIAMYLKRYHDITISPSGIWRILKKVGLSRLPTSQRYKRKETRWKRYEKQRPGHQLQVDVKFIEPLGQTGRKKLYYQYTAIDDCTRLRVLRAYPNHDQQTAIRFIDHVLSKLPFKVEKV